MMVLDVFASELNIRDRNWDLFDVIRVDWRRTSILAGGITPDIPIVDHTWPHR